MSQATGLSSSDVLRGAGQVTACAECEAPIRFLAGAGGKLNPINADPDPRGNLAVALEHGAYYPITNFDTYEGPRYMSHFATCPRADQFRKRGPRSRGRTVAAPSPVCRKCGKGEVEGVVFVESTDAGNLCSDCA